MATFQVLLFWFTLLIVAVYGVIYLLKRSKEKRAAAMAEKEARAKKIAEEEARLEEVRKPSPWPSHSSRPV